MTFPNVLPVSEFRAAVTKLIKDVAANPGRRVYVGQHRKPEAVLMSVSADMPPLILQALLDTYFSYLVECGPLSWDSEGKLLHIGDNFGQMFAWLWRRDQDLAMEYLEQYIQGLRSSERAPTVQSLEDVLGAMQFAIDLTDEEYGAICTRARADLAGRYPDPTATR
jgi:hypothetical protein